LSAPEVILDQLRALGIQPGDVLLVHTSFRAVRPVEGGPAGLIAALQAAVGPEGTLAMPSWPGDDELFNAVRTPAAADLGVVADTFWRMPDVLRSSHPFAFAARGPRAREVVEGELPRPPHGVDSPVGKIHDLDGQILLLGAGQDANTTIHLAEGLAEVPYRIRGHVTVMEQGRPRRLEVDEPDHCCQRFALADGWLRDDGAMSEGTVGQAHARLMRSRNVVRIVRERLDRDPLTFLHAPAAGCDECDSARESIAWRA
jgi:aminoglycoside 3-N-acetyltransferase